MEITEEMVTGAVNGWFSVGGDERFRDSVRQQIRAALEAALNPPKEPEIPVTEKMVDAGREAHVATFQYSTADNYGAIYRAMELKRREEEAQSPVCKYCETRHGRLLLCSAEMKAKLAVAQAKEGPRLTPPMYPRSQPGAGWFVPNQRSGRGRRKSDP